MKSKVLLGIFISLLFLYFSFWKPQTGLIFSGSIYEGLFGRTRIEVSLLLQALGTANYLVLIVIVGLTYLGWWIRAWRFQVLAQPVKKVSANLAFSGLMIGYLGNNILPLRAGEFMRAYVVGKRGGIFISSALALVVSERVLDMMMLLICFGLSLLFFPIPGLIRKAGIITLLVTSIILLFLLLLIFQRPSAMKIAETMLGIFPPNFRKRLLRIIDNFAQGLEIFRRSEHYFLVLLWTFVMWGVYLSIIYISLYLFYFNTLQYPLIYASPIVACIVMLTITTAGISIPSAPGAVGTYHGVCLFGMTIFGVASELGMSYAILMHLTNFLPMTLIGLGCLFKEGLKLAELSGAVEKKKEIVPEAK